jgi:hypothetical protein
MLGAGSAAGLWFAAATPFLAKLNIKLGEAAVCWATVKGAAFGMS